MKKKLTKRDVSEIINVLEKVKKVDFVALNKSLQATLDNMLERLKTNTFRLAVVGEFSSGKSTFLNAIIGKDILKHGVQETTATITEIQNLSEAENFDVYYVNGTTEKEIPMDKLIEYTSTSSKLHNVAQDIKKVVIKTRMFDEQTDVCLVDTPGLNGVADYHKEKTIELIESSHACIYLIQVRGLSESDRSFIKLISKYQHNIIFVQNFIDALKESESETPEQKVNEQKKILEKIFSEEEYDIKYSVVGISAKNALISRDREIKEYNGKILDEEGRKQLLEQSGYNDVKDQITKLILENEKGTIQKQDTIKAALILLQQLAAVLRGKSDVEEEKWNESLDGRKQKKYVLLKNRLQENKKAYWNKIENFTEARKADIQKKINNSLQEKLDEIIKIVDKKLNNIKRDDLYAIEHYINVVPNEVYSGIMKVEKDTNGLMNAGFNNVLSTISFRIQEYAGQEAETPRWDEHSINLSNKEVSSLKIGQEEEMIIAKENQKILEEKEKIKKGRQELEKSKHELNLLNIQKKIKYEEREEAYIKKQERLDAVGRIKPEAEKKTKQETVLEDWGGLGILDFFLGPIESTKTVEYSDYSKQEKWEKEVKKIEKEYQEKEDRYKAIEIRYKQKEKMYKEDVAITKAMEKIRSKEIKQRERKIELKKKELEEKRKKAKIEYIGTLKNMVRDNVRDYLDEDVFVFLDDAFQSAVKMNKEQVLKLGKNLFDISFTKRIQEYENVINGMKPDSNIKQQSDTIEKAIKLLERYV